MVLYSQELMTGVVVDSGDGVTHVVRPPTLWNTRLMPCPQVPVFDSYVLPDAVERLDVAGRLVTSCLCPDPCTAQHHH